MKYFLLYNNENLKQKKKTSKTLCETFLHYATMKTENWKYHITNLIWQTYNYNTDTSKKEEYFKTDQRTSNKRIFLFAKRNPEKREIIPNSWLLSHRIIWIFHYIAYIERIFEGIAWQYFFHSFLAQLWNWTEAYELW